MSNKKKMEVLYFVEQYIKRYGYPPTVRDIGKGLGYRSPSTVHGYLRKGQILRSTPNTAPFICGACNTQPEGLSTMA